MGTFAALARNPLCRLLTHVVVFVIYLCLGAAVFQLLEGPVEETLVTGLRQARDSFSDITHECVSGKQRQYRRATFFTFTFYNCIVPMGFLQ